LVVSEAMNECWSADFMSDALWGDRRFRTFNVVDDFNREVLAIEVDFNLPAQRVVRTLRSDSRFARLSSQAAVGQWAALMTVMGEGSSSRI
jgi:transposase InsO family protein